MEWLETVNGLVEQVRGWTDGTGLDARVVDDPEHPGVHRLELRADGKRLHLEPAMYAADRLPTAVDLYAFPSLIRVRLKGPDESGAWEIFTPQNLPLRRAWNQTSFLDLLSDLTAAV